MDDFVGHTIRRIREMQKKCRNLLFNSKASYYCSIYDSLKMGAMK